MVIHHAEIILCGGMSLFGQRRLDTEQESPRIISMNRIITSDLHSGRAGVALIQDRQPPEQVTASASHRVAISLTSKAMAALYLHEGNVRTHSGKDKDIDQLASSIASIGLLTPLIVKADSQHRYGVIAGGRRLAALKTLEASGQLPEKLTEGIPCRILDDKTASHTEISLSENVQRADMTAADQIDAWGALAREGLDVSTIASRFGVTETLVRQRLALASVIPEVLDLLRRELINLDTVRAFTLTDDPEKQRAVLAQDNIPSAWQVRQILAVDTVRADSKEVMLVGLEAYQAAGGRITHDLFDEDSSLIHDVDLLQQLVNKRLDEAQQQVLAEGWSWVKAETDYIFGRYNDHYRADMIEGHGTPEELDRQQEISALLDENPEHPDRETLMDEWDEIEARIETRATWSDDVKARGGVFISINYHGELDIDRGWLVREKIETEKQDQSAPASVYSNTLKIWLAKARTQITREALTKADNLCNDIIAFNLALRAATNLRRRKIGEISFYPEDFCLDDATTPCHAENATFRAGLDMTWCDADDDIDAFIRFRALPDAARQAWLNEAVARSVCVSLASPKNALIEAVIAELDIPWAKKYRPGKEFFSRLRKHDILEMMRPVLSDGWADLHANDKKSTLVEKVADIFAGRATLTANQQAAVEAWVPEGFDPELTASADPESDDEGTDDPRRAQCQGSTPQASRSMTASAWSISVPEIRKAGISRHS